MITTLNKIRVHRPCEEGWQRLLRHLGKTQADDEPLPLETVLDANGLPDALWCLRAVEGHDREIRLYAVWCARQAQHLMTDPRSVAALDVVERYARGKASAEELAAAQEAARAAASEAAWAAASEAARVTAAEARWAAEAASAAAAAASSSSAAEAARVTAWAAEAARVTAWAAEAAEAAWAAAQEAQATEFRRICREIEAGRDPYPEEEE